MRHWILCLMLLPAASLGGESSSNQVAILDTDRASLQERISILRSAQQGDEFHFSTAMFGEDKIGKTLTFELAEAAKRSVRVRGIFDPALYHLPDSYIHYLANAGVQLVEFHPTGTSLWQRIQTMLTPGKGITWLNNRSHDKIWALKKKLPNGEFQYMAIEGSRNFVDSNFGLNTTVEKPLPNGKMPRKGATLETLRPTGLQFDDIDIFIRGEAARQIIEYHNEVLASRHVGDRALVKRLRRFEDWNKATRAEQSEVLAYLEMELPTEEFAEIKKQVGTFKNVGRTPPGDDTATLKYLWKELTPRKTAREIEKAHAYVIDHLGIISRTDDNRPFTTASNAKLTFYRDVMEGNTPQGSEQGILKGIHDAQGGDLVKVSIAGKVHDIRFTADVFDQLEKLKHSASGSVVEVAARKFTVTPDVQQAFAEAFQKRKVGDVLHMISQYGIATPEILQAFTEATERGVTVKLVVNGATSMWDGQAAKRGYQFTFQDLAATGIELRESSGMNQIHTKALTVRNPVTGPKYLVIGSSNLDPRSLTIKIPGRGLGAWSTRLRNTELNWRISESPEIVEWYETKIAQTFYPGHHVTKNGKIIRNRPCSILLKALLKFPPAYRAL